MEISKQAKLLKEFRNQKFLMPFNELLVESMLKDVRENFYPEMHSILQFFLYYYQFTQSDENKDKKDPQYSSRVYTLHQFILRYKRCILAYLNKRLEIIDEAFWEFATNIPLDYKKALKQDEQDYLKNYKSLISDYSKSIGFDLTKARFSKKFYKFQLFIGFITT